MNLPTMPQWLLDLCNKPEQPPEPAPLPQVAPADTRHSAYAATAFTGELTRLTQASTGERNDQLNRSAFALGQLVGAGWLDYGTVAEALTGVAQSIGLPRAESRATVKSGLEAGRKEPRVLEDRPKDTTNGAPPHINQSIAPTPPTLPSRLMRAVDLDTLPPTKWLIDGVLGSNQMQMLFAPPGSGKSFLTLDICMTVQRHAKVLIIAAEAIQEYNGRVKSWCEFHNVTADNLYFWNGPVQLGNPDDVTTFLNTVQPLGFTLIVIDPLAPCMVGLEESSTGGMQVAVDSIKRIIATTTAGVFVVHHTGWNDEHERGSSSLRADCRVVMKLSKDDSGLMKLACAKLNGGEMWDAKYFRLLDRGEQLPVVVAATRVLNAEFKTTDKQKEVLNALMLLPLMQGATFTQLVEHTSFPKSTMNSVLHSLISKHLIDASDSRIKLYTITERGKDELWAAQNEPAPATEIGPDQGNWVVNTSSLGIVNSAPLVHIDHNEKQGNEFTPSSLPTSSVHTEFTSSSYLDRTSSSLVHSVSPLKGEQIVNSNELGMNQTEWDELMAELDTAIAGKRWGIARDLVARIPAPLQPIYEARVDQVQKEAL